MGVTVAIELIAQGMLATFVLLDETSVVALFIVVETLFRISLFFFFFIASMDAAPSRSRTAAGKC